MKPRPIGDLQWWAHLLVRPDSPAGITLEKVREATNWSPVVVNVQKWERDVYRTGMDLQRQIQSITEPIFSIVYSGVRNTGRKLRET